MAVTNGISAEKLTLLNEAAYTLVANFWPGRVQIFDAFLPLQARYNDLCRKYDFPLRVTKNWECQDKMHTGFVINDHYAQMLLNYVCNP